MDGEREEPSPPSESSGSQPAERNNDETEDDQLGQTVDMQLRHLVLRAFAGVQSFIADPVNENTALSAGQVLLKLEWFTLTNEATINSLASHRPSMWDLWPHEDHRYGRIPVWGTTSVVKSSVPCIAAGSKLYGQWPITSYSVAQFVCTEEEPDYLIETSAHRRKLPEHENRYYIISPTTNITGNDAQAFGILSYSMYFNAYILDTAILPNGTAKGSTVIITDAAQKVSVATAHRLKTRGDVSKIIGLVPDPKQKAYVNGTGFFTEVYAYSEVKPNYGHSSVRFEDKKYILVDYMYQLDIIKTLQEKLGKKKVQLTILGGESPMCVSRPCSPPRPSSPGRFPLPVTYFDAVKLFDQQVKALGAVAFFKSFDATFGQYVGARVSGLKLVREKGKQKVLDYYQKLVEGEVGPDVGLVLSL